MLQLKLVIRQIQYFKDFYWLRKEKTYIQIDDSKFLILRLIGDNSQSW